ncbi:Asp-tRNA(Asn)/Glu-tRNA(Gln) amidotransferase subunit GatC [Patescibacteria group bacterium]|nr:Asp-tRNA(Asn)/Glu-tRNA(Gln) amidotransferase subunit GatC [Patescibacteria group bacterium]
MKLTKDQIKHVAKLANLPLSLKEENKYFDQLSKILGYVEQLSQINTLEVEPTFNTSGQSNVMREDKITTSLSQEEALFNAPQKKYSRSACFDSVKRAGEVGMFATKGAFEEKT